VKYDYQSIGLSEKFSLKEERCAIGDNLSEQDKSEIEKIWNDEMARKQGHLFNGRLFSLIAREPEKIIGGFVDYQLYLAGLKNPLLKNILPIVPISVSCITCCESFVLIGRRSPFVTQFPGFYELAPSGGIEPDSIINGEVNLYRQVHLELEEETGLSADFIESSRLFGIIHDPEFDCIDLCVIIQMKRDVHNRSLQNTPEYTELKWIPLSKISVFCQEHAERIVPASQFLLFKLYLARYR